LIAISEESAFIRIGGETKLQLLVDRIFELLDNLPEVWELRQAFDGDLKVSQKITQRILAETFDVPGSNDLDHQEYELPLPVSERQLAQWHLCLRQALDELEVAEDLQNIIIDTLSCCPLPRATQVA